jgi:hypothetical protein
VVNVLFLHVEFALEACADSFLTLCTCIYPCNQRPTKNVTTIFEGFYNHTYSLFHEMKNIFYCKLYHERAEVVIIGLASSLDFQVPPSVV